jgi:uncharacterized protein (DUF305 family)
VNPAGTKDDDPADPGPVAGAEPGLKPQAEATVVGVDPQAGAEAGAGVGPPRWLVGVLAAVLAAALLVAGGALAVVTGIGQPVRPADDSVDAGFARDMTTHHGQATQMAQVVRDRGTDPAVRLVAFDIETQQLGQIGQMLGWLQSWALAQETDRPELGWLPAESGHVHDPANGALMPGMATPAEMAKLRSLSGKALDVYFLQLMIRHHQGGLPMARYAAEHASVDYVRDLGRKIVTGQSGEVVTLEQMLRERGAEPLPAP